jgi:hypothetical protein
MEIITHKKNLPHIALANGSVEILDTTRSKLMSKHKTTINNNTDDSVVNADFSDSLYEKMMDAMTPGYQVECDPDEAERAGAFVEDALSEQDALESTVDSTDLELTS